jgi:hypothetical protein
MMSINELRPMARTIYISFFLLLLCGCAVQPVVPRIDANFAEERNSEILKDLRGLGRNADWLVARGYHVTDDMVSTFTNMPFSHAAVLDYEANQVIEADSSGVHTTPLAEFIAKSQRIMLVRSVWSNGDTAGNAIVKARSLVGRPYDFFGLVGVNIPNEYYCSELAIDIYRSSIRSEDHIPRPVAPGQLHYWGRILFDSGAL